MASEAAGISGGTIGALGDLYSGQSTSSALNSQAQQNLENAQLAREQGEYNSMRAGMMAAQHVGGIKAAYGANGVESTSGSVLSVLNGSAMNAEMDVQNIKKGAEVRAINFENEASMEKLGASNAVTSSYLNALSSITMGSAKAFGQAPSSAGDEGADEGELDSGDSGAADGADGADGGTAEAGAGEVSSAGGMEEAVSFA